jgi:hypothetical protein
MSAESELSNVKIIKNSGQWKSSIDPEIEFSNSCLFISIHDYMRYVHGNTTVTVDGLRNEVNFIGYNKDFSFYNEDRSGTDIIISPSQESLKLIEFLDKKEYKIQFYDIDRRNNKIVKTFQFPDNSTAKFTIPIASYGNHFELITSINSGDQNAVNLEINRDLLKKDGRIEEPYGLAFYINRVLVRSVDIDQELMKKITQILDKIDLYNKELEKARIKYMDATKSKIILDEKIGRLGQTGQMEQMEENVHEQMIDLSGELEIVERIIHDIPLKISVLETNIDRENARLNKLFALHSANKTMKAELKKKKHESDLLNEWIKTLSVQLEVMHIARDTSLEENEKQRWDNEIKSTAQILEDVRKEPSAGTIDSLTEQIKENEKEIKRLGTLDGGAKHANKKGSYRKYLEYKRDHTRLQTINIA